MQGVSWFTRKAITITTITLDIKQYIDENGVVHIEIEQTGTGGIKGTTELHIMDWTERLHKDYIFDNLKGRGRMLNLDQEVINDDFLSQGWLEVSEESGGPHGGRHIQSFVDASGWTGNQVWGFAMIKGQRRYTRRIVVIRGREVKKIRIVYDWQGKK